jgi:hypothetical protein
VCCSGQLENFWFCPVPTTETPTGFGASGANNKCLWFFSYFFLLLPSSRTDSPKPVRNKLQHAPSTCSFNCLLSYPPPPHPPAPNDSAGGPLMSSVAHYCVQSLHDSEHRERERTSFTSIFYFHLKRLVGTESLLFLSNPSLPPLPFSLSLSLSSWVLGFRELNFSSLEFYFIFLGGGR